MVVEKKKKPYAVIGLPFSIYLLELDDFAEFYIELPMTINATFTNNA